MTDLIVDAEVVPMLDRPSAERLDRRLRLMVDATNENLAKLQELVAEAKRGGVHSALGYPSWTAYLADVFSVQVRLDREQRRELVSYLSGEGLSNRNIAGMVGVDEGTVRNDQKARAEFSARDPHRTVTDTLGRQQPAAKPPRPPEPADQPEPPVVVCRDCDGYGCETCFPEEVSAALEQENDGAASPLEALQRQIDQAPQRKPPEKPITKSFDSAAYELKRAVKRVVSLSQNDRFKKNKDQIADVNLSDLIRVRDAIDGVIQQLEG